MRSTARLLLAASSALLVACVGEQSALDTHGPIASHLEHLILGTVWVCAAVWTAVMATLFWVLLRRARPAPRDPALQVGRARRAVIVAVGITAVTLVMLTTASFLTTRVLGDADENALTITVRGEQWWWRIIYGADSSRFETANEIHIPTQQNVRLKLEAADVIHSFWVPNLAGKQDLIPGRTNTLTIRAETPGVYRGQCAEFCGLQHSHMALEVVAQSAADFARWQAAQRRDAVPATAEALAGQTLFMNKPCAGCHVIRGTPAAGPNGPDLTHVASRRMIGAGLVETSRGSLAAWIADPQTLKPGNNMPLVTLKADELRALSAYMAALQ